MGVLLQVAILLQLVLLLQPGACQAQLQQQGEVIDTDYNILNQPFPTGVRGAGRILGRGHGHAPLGDDHACSNSLCSCARQHA